ncbi:uncharacterized protein PV09_08773 [Verruconis gallopava]|uniref:Exoribonuclease phosphorolytic domain-containing protein n=1 Tax=Verruconis gallopava TaxID=253628 RepID=A0A0D1ZYU6_9PEZI|nr:uncharacterized protein PV09_08773 [Verruconis gallopava]KIV99597.1 hypothetical protein PV09_08773 [Verruconis gallopava]
MNDRRRINGPVGKTTPPVFKSTLASAEQLQDQRPARARKPDELRKIFLRTGVTPSASGSAYYELTSPLSPTKDAATSSSFLPPRSCLKIACTVHGPHPLPRSAPYNSSLVLTTTLKFAPFATRHRRGYVRDATERDLSAHLETALKGVIIGERWPKSGVDIIVTVLEGEEDRWWGDEVAGGTAEVGGWGTMPVLAGAITAASVALADAGIDCVDLVSGGVAAVVGSKLDERVIVLDPSPAEHENTIAACVVGYLSERDEVTELWVKGDAGDQIEALMEKAVDAAAASRTVLVDAVVGAGHSKFPSSITGKGTHDSDEDMAG